MRHRLPLLRPLSALVTIFVLTAAAVFGLLRLERVEEVLVTPGQRLSAGQV